MNTRWAYPLGALHCEKLFEQVAITISEKGNTEIKGAKGHFPIDFYTTGFLYCSRMRLYTVHEHAQCWFKYLIKQCYQKQHEC